MDVWEYFASRDRELGELSVVWDEVLYPYSAEMGSDGQRGMVFGRIDLTDQCFVSVHEVVQVKGSGVTREKYAYYLICDEQELWGEERDPTHNPAVHRHNRNHDRYPSSVISFKDFVSRAWAMVSAEAELEGGEDSPEGEVA